MVARIDQYRRSQEYVNRPAAAKPATIQERELISAGLRALMDVQKRNAALLPRTNDMGQPGSATSIRVAHQALGVEVGELYNELDIKPWREPKGIDKARVIDEFGGDVLHFLAWLMNELEARDGLTPDNWAAGFFAKSVENIARFQGKVPGREPPDWSSIFSRGGEIGIET